MEAAERAYHHQHGSEVDAMILPAWPNVKITRRKEMVSVRGINYSDNVMDGDLAACENLSDRRWPYLASRNGRTRQEDYQGITALTHFNGIVAVRPGYHGEAWEDELLYNGESVGWLDHTDKPRQFAAVNTKLVIWPDQKYLDLNDLTVKPMGAETSASRATFREDGKGVSFAGVPDLQALFRPGDGVEISGLTELEDNNITVTVQKVAAASFTVDGAVFTPGTETAAITLRRNIPDMDYICESGNRLWGCENATKTIYASSLGDPTNFFVSGTGAAGSYSFAVATPGDFTGACRLGSSVLFWKEQVLHKVLGSYPAEYYAYTYEIEGVRAGCAKSMTVINDVLYYVGLHGVFAYAGGTPGDISTVFGTHLLTDAAGGTDGEKYWLSCLDDGKEALYVYSPAQRVWLREDGFRFTDIAREGEDVYLLRRDGSVWLADSREADPEIDWSLEYTPFTETLEGRKRVSRLLIRLEMPEGAWFQADTSTDGEPWKEAGLIKGPKADTVPVMVQPKRGDQYRIRLRGHGPCVIKGVLREYLQGGYQ